MNIEELRVRIFMGGEVAWSAVTEDDPDSEAPIHTDTARRWVKAGVPVHVMAQDGELQDGPEGEKVFVEGTEEWYDAVPVFEPARLTSDEDVIPQDAPKDEEGGDEE